MTPLDLYLRDAPEAAARRAAVDYGRAIRDLAYTDVFPGDLLLKNFGVTRHGRVVFYDYDELCRVSDCQFRDLPPGAVRRGRDARRAVVLRRRARYFSRDTAEFPRHAGAVARRVSCAHTRICINPAFWRRTQQRIAAGEVLEVLPYVPPEAGEDGAGAPATARRGQVRRRQLAGGLPRAAGPPSRGGRRSGSMDALAANARRHSGEHT